MVAPISKKALAAMKGATETLSSSLEDIRQRIIAALDERAEIEQAPVAEGQARERVQAWADGVRGDALRRIGADRFTGPHYRPPAPAETLDICIAMMAQTAATSLAELIAQRYVAGAGLTDAERAASLAENAKALLDLELAEEALIRTAEHNGLAILRRADADPRAVLAIDEDMP